MRCDAVPGVVVRAAGDVPDNTPRALLPHHAIPTVQHRLRTLASLADGNGNLLLQLALKHGWQGISRMSVPADPASPRPPVGSPGGGQPGAKRSSGGHRRGRSFSAPPIPLARRLAAAGGGSDPVPDRRRGLDELLQLLLRAFPDATRHTLQPHGWMPLHQVMAQPVSAPAVLHILRADPAAALLTDNENNLPLHHAGFLRQQRVLGPSHAGSSAATRPWHL